MRPNSHLTKYNIKNIVLLSLDSNSSKDIKPMNKNHFNNHIVPKQPKKKGNILKEPRFKQPQKKRNILKEPRFKFHPCKPGATKSLFLETDTKNDRMKVA